MYSPLVFAGIVAALLALVGLMWRAVDPTARYRKLWYLGIIVLLFSCGLAWRRVDMNFVGGRLVGIDAQAAALNIREESRGEADLTGSFVRIGLTGSRGLATCFFWNVAIEAQKKNQWNKLEVVVRSLTKLQPHFITPWLFQSWNLSYNVSVESDRVRDKYFYVSRGIDLLAQGERQNRDHPDLRWSVGFYLQHKIMQSDDTNLLRSLFQLSLIPPNERDPARFWRRDDEGGVELDYNELHDFVEKHPQLVRRLREGMRKDTERDKGRLFFASKPADLVRFLDDNSSVPSIYEPLPATNVPAYDRPWTKAADKLLRAEDRFPPLPPEHADPFDKDALTQNSQLGDDQDCFAVTHAWFCYAQEPLPAPSNLPGISQEISDRARQRKPRNMTTLIFRNYPAQARRYQAERLQTEGWFDEEPYDVSDWFASVKDKRVADKVVKVGGGSPLSQDAWLRSLRAWEKHGRDNLVLFADAADEQNQRDLASDFVRRTGVQPGSLPPPLDESQMGTRERDEYRAFRILYEYNFYRGVSNFGHHYNRSLVESKPETVLCRKLFDRATRAYVNGARDVALSLFRTPYPFPGGQKLSPLDAWRELVLLKNDEFRRDHFNQEATADLQIRYLDLYNQLVGDDDKKLVASLSPLLPFIPKADEFARPPVEGPFDRRYVKNERGELEESGNGEGEQLITDPNYDVAMERLHRPVRRSPTGTGGVPMPGIDPK